MSIALSAQAEFLGAGGTAQDFPTVEESLRAFTDVGQVAYLVIGILLAIALSATIAFHPRRKGRVTEEEDLEYPKTIILFAVVGAIVAQIVRVSPAMALVVFGIGGLIRFRTRIGAPADTGHAILSTLIGIAAGMGLYLLAIIGTATGWFMIFAMESQRTYHFRVRDLDEEAALDSRATYLALLKANGWRVLGEAHRPDKGKLDYYLRGRGPEKAEELREVVQEVCGDTGVRFRLDEV